MMHVDLLKLLLPPVSMESSNAALAGELAADGHALDLALADGDQLLLEDDPRATVALLADWERVYGLPESCICQAGIVQSIAERRAALVAKVGMVGAQTPAFFINLAAALGYSITLTEWRPYTSEMHSDYGVTDEPWEFVWQVNSTLNTVRELRSDDDTEMATEVWGNALMECVINRYKPAHTLALFAYS
ncbi:putative phage tail protein [Chitinivorax sp. PXF-14]|uniref:YmfQ family protein n=1 Tax=Chitinivorax sp. PXF-14 TaxID=3230488 RepID=UPI0034652C6E